jgi:hypothetical protein
MKTKNNAGIRTAIPDCGWAKIQQDYDAGMTQREISDKYDLPTVFLWKAFKRGDLIARSYSEASKLAYAQGKLGYDTLSDESKESQRSKLSAIINRRYDEGWMPRAGRAKKYFHPSPTAGDVWLDGTWELGVAKWMDEQKWTWRRNTTRFSYVKPSGKPGNYTPDFWVNELAGFLEVKGHETDLDRCKWSQFNEPLVVWKRAELEERSIIPKRLKKTK